MQACHNDGNRLNCKLENLRWDTISNNHKDKRIHGTWQIGEKANNSKYTEKIIREMNRKHIVYQVNTGFEPTVEFSENRKVVWGSILKSQSEDEKRNELIINIEKITNDSKVQNIYM